MSKFKWYQPYEDQQDQLAANSSEVFKNYLKIMAANDAAKKEDEEPEPEPAPSPVPEPLKANMDYGTKATAQEEEVDPTALVLDYENYPDEGKGSSKVNDLYTDSGAGESDYITVGLTPETMKEMENGIDYADTNHKSSEPAVVDEELPATEVETDEVV